MNTRTILKVVAGIIAVAIITVITILAINLVSLKKDINNFLTDTKNEMSQLKKEHLSFDKNLNELQTATAENKKALTDHEIKTDPSAKFKELDNSIADLKTISTSLTTKIKSLDDNKDYSEIIASLDKLNKKLNALCLTVKFSDDELAERITDLREIIVALNEDYLKIVQQTEKKEVVKEIIITTKPEVVIPKMEKKQNFIVRFFKFIF